MSNWIDLGDAVVNTDNLRGVELMKTQQGAWYLHAAYTDGYVRSEFETHAAAKTRLEAIKALLIEETR